MFKDGTRLEEGTTVGEETFVCHKGQIEKKPAITFAASTDEDDEIFRIRGFVVAKE